MDVVSREEEVWSGGWWMVGDGVGGLGWGVARMKGWGGVGVGGVVGCYGGLWGVWGRRVWVYWGGGGVMRGGFLLEWGGGVVNGRG